MLEAEINGSSGADDAVTTGRNLRTASMATPITICGCRDW